MAEQQKYTFKVARTLDDRAKKAIGEDVIDFIIERTRKGLNKNNRPWSGKAGIYSEGYKKSLDFRIAGKSTGLVNLTLSGNMLDSMKVLDTDKPGEITIGFDKSDPDNAKAEGNILGTYGKKSPISGKARPFLAMSTDDLTKIKNKYPVKDDKTRAINIFISEQIRKSAEEIVGKIKRNQKVFDTAIALILARELEEQLEEEAQ